MRERFVVIMAIMLNRKAPAYRIPEVVLCLFVGVTNDLNLPPAISQLSAL